MTEVLRAYYESFSKYLAMEQLQISFEEFRQEMNSMRLGVGLGTGMFILFVLLSPDTLGGDEVLT